MFVDVCIVHISHSVYVCCRAVNVHEVHNQMATHNFFFIKGSSPNVFDECGSFLPQITHGNCRRCGHHQPLVAKLKYCNMFVDDSSKFVLMKISHYTISPSLSAGTMYNV